jgi:hypothetical protein
MTETACGHPYLSLSSGTFPAMTTSQLGYARVSTRDQDPSAQVARLQKEGCSRVWTEYASGVKQNRLELQELLDYARPGDTLVICRLARSLTGTATC